MGIKFKWLALVLVLGCVGANAQTRPQVGPFNVISPSSTTVPQSIKAAAGQTADLLDFIDSAGVIKSKVANDGSISGVLKVLSPPLSPFLAYVTTSGVVTPSPAASYDATNNRLGFFTSTPTTALQFAATSRFSAPVVVDDNGLTTFTFGREPASADIGGFNFNLANARFGTELRTLGAGVGGSANQWGVFIGCHVGKLATTSAYEKACLFVSNETQDPSHYGADIARDAVGADIRGGIRGGTSNGRVWGIVASANVSSGSDGTAVGVETDLNNNGSDQAGVDQTTTKAGSTVFSIGANPGSIGFGIFSSSGATNGWHKGVFARQSSVIDSFLELYKTSANTHMFKVLPTGQTLIGDLANDATLNNYDPTVYGALAVLNYMTVPASTSEKNALYLLSDASITTHRIGSTRYDGSVSFWPLALDTAGNQVMKLTVDPFVQLTTSYAGGNLSAAGTVALRNHAGVLEASQNAGAWTAIGSGETTPDCTESSQTILCVISGANATYLQVENNTNGTTAQAVLSAQVSNTGTAGVLVGATPPMFTTASGIPANAAYVSGGSTQAAGLYLQNLASAQTHFLINSTQLMALDPGGSLLFNTSGQGLVFNLNGGGGNESAIVGTAHSVNIYTDGTYGGAATEVIRGTGNVTDGVCIRINGSLRRLTLVGVNVTDGGAC